MLRIHRQSSKSEIRRSKSEEEKFFANALSWVVALVLLKAMDEVFQMTDAQAAQAFLNRFPPDAQRRGHERFRAGAVENLVVTAPGSAYSAEVQDSAWRNEVSLLYDPVNGWEGSCSCPRQAAGEPRLRGATVCRWGGDGQTEDASGRVG